MEREWLARELDRGRVRRFGRTGSFRCPRCVSERVSRRRRRLKEILVAEAGGACVACGYDRYIGALQFHHLDRREKRFQLAGRGLTRALSTLRREAEKCVLLCANCHAEVEAGRLPSDLSGVARSGVAQFGRAAPC